MQPKTIKSVDTDKFPRIPGSVAKRINSNRIPFLVVRD